MSPWPMVNRGIGFDTFLGDPCATAPTISTHTVNDTGGAPGCSPDVGWRTESVITLSGPLGTLRIERERATDSAGTSWVFWIRSVNLSETFDHGAPHYGAAEAGCDEITKWFKSRARIVDPDNGDAPCGDGSWTTSGQISFTEFTCPPNGECP